MDIEKSLSDDKIGKPKAEICKDKTEMKKIKNIAKTGIIISFDEFAQNSTLHGLRYIVDSTLSYVEKLFWLIVVIASIVVCGSLINNAWTKWQSSPIIITMNEKLVPVDSVYYPSVTICPQTKIKHSSFIFEAEKEFYEGINWIINNETLRQGGLNKFADMALVCDQDLRGEIVNLRLPNYNVNIDNILKAALDFEDVFESCFWISNPTPCRSLFQKVLIREGVCFTMNALDSDEIMRTENVMNNIFLSDKNYRKNLSSGYPIRGSANNELAEFMVYLREYDYYKDKSCKRYYTGFIIYFQHPEDMPQASIQSHKVDRNQIMSLAFKFESVSTSEDLISYPIEARQCFFPGERYLQFFLTYTESNCRIECITNYTKQLCGCVAFYMPHDNGIRICPVYYMQCVDVAQILLFGFLQESKIDLFMDMYSHPNDTVDVSLIDQGKKYVRACNCLPTCNSVNYEADIMKVDYDLNYYFDLYCNDLHICDKDNRSYEYAQVQWIFKQPKFVGMVRSSIFGVTDFIAQCGGLLGLFLGFSFLTVVEIFYYITMRFAFIMKREKMAKKSCDKENFKEISYVSDVIIN